MSEINPEEEMQRIKTNLIKWGIHSLKVALVLLPALVLSGLGYLFFGDMITFSENRIILVITGKVLGGLILSSIFFLGVKYSNSAVTGQKGDASFFAKSVIFFFLFFWGIFITAEIRNTNHFYGPNKEALKWVCPEEKGKRSIGKIYKEKDQDFFNDSLKLFYSSSSGEICYPLTKEFEEKLEEWVNEPLKRKKKQIDSMFIRTIQKSETKEDGWIDVTEDKFSSEDSILIEPPKSSKEDTLDICIDADPGRIVKRLSNKNEKVSAGKISQPFHVAFGANSDIEKVSFHFINYKVEYKRPEHPVLPGWPK